jgi:hypothetical protein
MCRLRANLDETRLALEVRNSSLEKLQQSVLEKEQVCKIVNAMFLGIFCFCLVIFNSRNA